MLFASPPLQAAADVVVLASQVDGVVLIAFAGNTYTNALEKQAKSFSLIAGRSSGLCSTSSMCTKPTADIILAITMVTTALSLKLHLNGEHSIGLADDGLLLILFDLLSTFLGVVIADAMRLAQSGGVQVF